MNRMLLLCLVAVSFLLPAAGTGGAAEWVSPWPYPLKDSDFVKQVDGKQVGLYTIRNAKGMEVKITNYGAKIQQIVVPDRYGRMGDVVQGYETIDKVMGGQASMNAFIGRFANRIGGGKLTLDGQTYQLAINDGNRPNTIHGGTKGSRFIVFGAKQLSPSAVEMTILFKDGEEGFPGDLPVRIVYSLTDNNELVLDYAAVSTSKTTVLNFTGHSFFNLSGDPGTSIEDHVFTVNADKVLEVSDALTPTGKLIDVAGTPLDFRAPKAMGKDIKADYYLLKGGNGVDNHFVVNQKNEGELTFNARVADPKSGRVLEVFSTEPGTQVYSGNFLEGLDPRDVGKGYVFKFRSAFCIEPSHFPDSPNHPEFKTVVLRPGEWYSGKIVYKFSTDR